MSEDQNENNVIRIWAKEPINMVDFLQGAAVEANRAKAVRAMVTLFDTNGDRYTLEYNMRQSDVAVAACDYLAMATTQPDD